MVFLNRDQVLRVKRAPALPKNRNVILSEVPRLGAERVEGSAVAFPPRVVSLEFAQEQPQFLRLRPLAAASGLRSE